MPGRAISNLQYFWQDGRIGKEFRSGVSLHSHTLYSEESLQMVARYTGSLPCFGAAMRRIRGEYGRKTGYDFDLRRAFWVPPFTPQYAYRIEEKQIERRFELPALVSLTDHDDIRACSMLRLLDRFRHVPISTEWTIPFGPTFFHLGIHNIPVTSVTGIMARMREFTIRPDERVLEDILAALNSHSETLLVLNHPLWDEKGIGLENHERILSRLIGRFGQYFHALELNGLRSWPENRRVMVLARETGMPLVSGGDRHGREPNAILNLSRGETLAEFIHEIRYGGFSHIVFMPQYREPLALRILQTTADIVRDYPANPDSHRLWMQRVFHRDTESEAPIPLSAIWSDGGPKLVKYFATAMRILSLRRVQSILRFASPAVEGSTVRLAYARGSVWRPLLFSRVHERGGARWKEDQ